MSPLRRRESGLTSPELLMSLLEMTASMSLMSGRVQKAAMALRPWMVACTRLPGLRVCSVSPDRSQKASVRLRSRRLFFRRSW